MLRTEKLRADELEFTKFFYSQFGEDCILSTIFQGTEDGFYVDVGAFHPIDISNTYYFNRRGWRGINVEANPLHFPEFEVQRPNDINLNVAVSSSTGDADFVCDGPFSGILDSNFSSPNRVQNKELIKIPQQSLSSIFVQYLPKDQIIHFLSVDCEGHDLDVLSSNSWNEFRPKVVLVEDHSHSTDCETLRYLNEVGFQLYCKIGYTLICFDERCELKERLGQK